MVTFTNGGNVTDGGALELDGASFITSADVGGTTYVFTAGAVDSGISVFSLGLDGALTNIANVTDSGALNLVGVSGLTTITSNGNTYLIAAGAGDNGLSVFRVSTAGALSPVYDVADGGALNLGGVSRVTSATVSGNAYVFAAGTNDDGISVFRVQGDGKLTSVYDLSDNGTLELDGVKGMTTATIGGNTFLFAAGGVDDGVSIFNVASNGTLINTSNVTDDGTLKLDGASDVASAVVGGVTYLFVTGANDNGVSVFSVNSSGILTNVANVGDTAGLRLAGATGVTVSTFGTTTYLTVGGTENGVSMFRVDVGGTLTFVDNIDDAGARELAGTTQLHTATVGGTNYIIAAGSTDDGISTFGLNPTGQLWYLTQGNVADARLVYVNSDGLNHTTLFDNTPSLDLGTSFPQDVVMDTAAGVYYVLSDGGDGSNARILMGHIGSTTPPTAVRTFSADGELVNAMHLDVFNNKLYVSVLSLDDFSDATQGIKVFDYNPTTGALSNEQFLFTQTTAGLESSVSGGLGAFAARDFDVDAGRGFIYFTNQLLGDGFEANMVYRLDLNNPGSPAVALAPQAQFPLDGDGSEFITLNGIIQDIEIDPDSNRAYFLTHAEETSDPDAENAIWMVANASTTNGSGNAVKVTVVGVTAADFYPGDMTLDEVNNILYIESENVVDGGVDDDDVIWAFQLDAAGTTATLINTISPGFGDTANIGGMQFNVLPTLSSLNGTSTQMNEQQTAATILLTGAPDITDIDGDHLAGATVQITGGKFSSNESSTTDDHLGYGAAKQISGQISGTNITVSWNASTESLTLSGYDTITNYQAVLAAITYWTTGDNPTNYGLNTSRTITWTVSDGTPDVPGGSQNSGTTTISIAAVNDAPINGNVSSATGNEDNNIAITGLQINDADANPALQTMSITLSVTKGVLTLLTNVTNGLTAGEISGNGTSTVTISGTLNHINATLAATNGLLFLGDTNVNGTDTLTVITNDGGGTGSGGALSDTNFYTVTINAVNDAPVVISDGTETLSATNEDVADAALTNTVATLFGGQYDDSADQVSGGSSANAFAGVAVIANGSTAGTGQWQYHNGSTWVNIGAASTAAAVTISASTAIRFLSAADYNGPAPTLTTKLIDASGGALTNGATVNVTTSGGSTPYSAGTVVLDHTVTAVNDAPVTVGGAAVALTTIGEDSAPGAGDTVSSLYASHFSDAKDQVSGGSSANAFTGIAITSNTATAAQGVYQYFSGGVWQDIPSVSTSGAFVLDASTLVRFVPAADFSGTPPALTVYMIDDSAGAVTTGSSADLTTTGGSTQYGTATTLGITITPINDAPVAIGSATLASVNEDTAAPGGQTVTTLFGSNFSEVDVGDSLAGVAITGNATTSQGVWQYFNGAWITIGAPSESTALVLAGGTLVRFLPAADFNGTVPALTAYLIDNSGGAVTTGSLLDVSVNGGQTRFSDTSIELTTSITAVNDTPVVPASATTVNATEQTAAVLLGSVTVSDVELDALNGGSGDYVGASFTVQRTSANAVDTFAFASGGLFTVSGSNLQVGGLTFATFDSLNGVLTISFTSSGSTATSALVNDVIEHITYTNASDAPPASVTLNYALNDGSPGGGQGTGGTGTAGSSVLVNITAVNDAPTGGASVTGTAAEDQVLTAVSTLADSDGIGTLHYQWQQDVGGGYVNVGADQSTYALGDGDIGGVVRVVIYYVDAGGTVELVTSAATAAIAASNDAPTGGVSIIGTTTEDQVLTADTSTLADSDGLGTLHYDWQRDTGSGFVSIGAADQATYTLDDADVGGVIRVVTSYTDGQSFANSVTSSATAAISGLNDPHTGGVSITGTAIEDQVLTADTSTLADADGVGTLHYDWQRDTGSGFVSIGAADQATYTLDDADVGGVVRVEISYTDGQGFAEATTSASTAAIANVNDAPAGGVSITGTTTEDQVLTADTSTLVDDDGLGTLHYQWQRNSGFGFVNVGTDQATYTLGDADVGSLIRVVTAYVDQQGTAEAVTSAASAAIAAVNDPHTGGASIIGTTTEDQMLTAVSSLADVDGLGTLYYQWQRDTGSGYANVGTNQATYTLGDADVGGLVRVVISYTDGQGFAEMATSAASAAIANVNDAPTGGVSITGTTSEYQMLTADTSNLLDADGLSTLHFQWQRDTGSGYVNVGSDQATYTLGSSDIGGVVRVVTSYVDQQGTTEAVTSAATAAIANVSDAPTGSVSITGTTSENQVLTADTSTLADADGLGTLHYQWQRDTGSGFVNVGTDQATYTLGDADVGGLVRVVTSYNDGQGTAEAVTSAATAVIAGIDDPHTGGASITGTTTEDQVLTADTSTLADADGLGTLHYDWQRDTGSGFVSIGAADQSTYTLGDADVGGVVRVEISYTDGQGFAESSTSAATATISGINDAPTGSVSITGTTSENQVLTADTSTLADAEGLGTLHYQWQRDTGSGFVNVGTDQATYTLGDADVGGVVRVVTSYNDGQGFANSVTSNATAAIAGIDDPHIGGASITGTTTEDQVLTAVSTLADTDGLGTLHYDWQRDTGSGFVSIGAADQSTYTLGDADVGGVVRVVIGYTDGQGFAETTTSASTAAIANVNDAPIGSVSITGTTSEDQVLTANTSTLADADGLGTLHYQWQRDTGSGFVNVGTDQITYALGDADVDSAIRVVISYTDDQGTAEEVTSAATAAIGNVNDAPVLTGDLNAIVTEGEFYTLRATDIGFADPDDSAAGIVFNVSGVVNGTLSVDGETATSFTAADIEAGKVKFLHDGSETVAASFEVSVEDGNADNSVPAPSSFDFTVTPVNDVPTLDVTQTRTTIAENASTAAARKVAILAITDADGGENTLSLAGADANLFEIKSGALWLKAGVKLDFEQNPDLDVTVRLKDPTIGTGYVDSQALTLAVRDVKEIIGGTSGNDTLTGTDDRDVIKGWGGNDLIKGGDDRDILMGNRGNDIIIGNRGNDIIKGGAGNDTLIGGIGIDTLYGGAGKDVFVFGPPNPLSGADGRDIVIDFEHGKDKLDVSRFDANGELSGDQAFVWRGTGDFSDKSGDLIYRTFDVAGTANDKTIVYGDVNHDGNADFRIELAGIIELTKGDFIL